MIEEAKEKLGTFSLPAKPKTFGESYIFPEDVSNLSSTELGTWMFKLAAWKGYAIKLLAYSEIERAGLKAKHENKLARKIAQDSIDNKKVTKDHALGMLIENGGEFKDIRRRLTIKEAEVDSLKQIVEIYTMQIEVVSREISRRALDIKMIQKGIGDTQE